MAILTLSASCNVKNVYGRVLSGRKASEIIEQGPNWTDRANFGRGHGSDRGIGCGSVIGPAEGRVDQ